MGMQYLEMDEIKKRELDILLAFDEFASDSNLRYSLAYGTLLGAVRHKGFIPWDDDIDVIVPRPDYNRIVDFAKKNVKLGPYKFIGYEIDGFPMPIIKMIDTRIRVEDHVTRKTLPLHLWIDIFPLDPVRSDPKEFFNLYKRAYFLRSIIKVGNYKFWGAGRTRTKRIAKMIATLPTRLFRLNNVAEKKLQALAQNICDYKEATHVASLVWGPYWSGEQFEKSMIESFTLLEFEGYQFPAISKWDYYLTTLYGDYMRVPPENEQFRHGVKAWYIENL